MEEKFGYKLHSDSKTTPIITLPYADDFCLITTDIRTYQKIRNEIQSNICSMGMKLKPSKCRSLSIRSGTSSKISFNIGNTSIPSISDEEQKILRKLLFFLSKLEKTFNLVHDTLKGALENIKAFLIWSQYKLLILKLYLIPLTGSYLQYTQ